MIAAAVFYIIAAAAAVAFLVFRWWRLTQDAESLGFAAFVATFAYNAALAVSVILLGEWPGVNVFRLIGAAAAAVVAVGLLIVAVRARIRDLQVQRTRHARPSI